MFIQPWNSTLIRLFCLTTCYLVTSTTGVTSALATLHSITDWLCRQIQFARNFMRDFTSRFWMRAATTASLSLEKMHGKHARNSSLRWRLSINRIFHMDVVSGRTCTSHVIVTFFIHIWCWYGISFRETSNTNQWLWARHSSSHWAPFRKRGADWWAIGESRASVVTELPLPWESFVMSPYLRISKTCTRCVPPIWIWHNELQNAQDVCSTCSAIKC